MSVFPTAVEARAFADARALSTWVGISDAAFDAVENQLGSFNGRIRNLALLPGTLLPPATAAATVVTAAATTTAPETTRRLSPVEVAQFGLCWRIAKRLASQDWDAHVDVDPFAPAPPPAALPAAPAAPPPATPSAKVKFNAVLDQHDETETSLASEAQIVAWGKNWVAFAHGPPLDEEDPTIEQLSALYHRVLVLLGSPYADFAVFTPFNRRVARANKFTAHIPQADGSWLSKEIPGPQNFEAWCFCWRVFRCAMIQLDIAREAALSRYFQVISTLVLEWPECWSIIYLADDKARAEGLARRRRQIEADIAGGQPAPPLWDATKPWSACFMSLASDNAYWDAHVRHLAVSWLARGKHGSLKTREQLITETAITGGSAAQSELARNTEPPAGMANGPGLGKSKHARQKQRFKTLQAQLVASQASASSRSTPYTPTNKGGGKDKGKGKGRGGGKGGKQEGHTMTPQGKQICFNFNRGVGTCGAARPGSACPQSRAHVCQVCLSTDHAAKDHPHGR